MIFELDETEIKRFSRWKNSLPEISEDCLDVFGKEFQYTFKFHAKSCLVKMYNLASYLNIFIRTWH